MKFEDMQRDKCGQLILNEKQQEQLRELFMGIRSGECLYFDDDGNIQKGEMGLLEGEDENDPVSRDDESYL